MACCVHPGVGGVGRMMGMGGRYILSDLAERIRRRSLYKIGIAFSCDPVLRFFAFCVLYRPS